MTHYCRLVKNHTFDYLHIVFLNNLKYFGWVFYEDICIKNVPCKKTLSQDCIGTLDIKVKRNHVENIFMGKLKKLCFQREILPN